MKVLGPARLQTLLDLGIERLTALGCALDFAAEDLRVAREVFQRCASGWAAAPLRGTPRWASDITDDHTPFEFSLAIDDGRPELRFLCEAQGDVPSQLANWEAAHALNRELAAEHGIDLERLARVADLFTPTPLCPRFGLWHAVCLRPGEKPDFKAYLNPQASGPQHARRIVTEAMDRLGLGDAWRAVPELRDSDEPCYFSLDLAAHGRARTKVYIAHPEASVECIERAVSTAQGYVPGRAAEFCRAMSATAAPYRARPLITCLSFVEGSSRPSAATVHFPVRAYAQSDSEVRERALNYMHGATATIYRGALDTFARRSLSERSGMQTYVSLRLHAERQRITVYLAPEVYAVPPRGSARPSRPSIAAADVNSV